MTQQPHTADGKPAHEGDAAWAMDFYLDDKGRWVPSTPYMVTMRLGAMVAWDEYETADTLYSTPEAAYAAAETEAARMNGKIAEMEQEDRK